MEAESSAGSAKSSRPAPNRNGAGPPMARLWGDSDRPKRRESGISTNEPTLLMPKRDSSKPGAVGDRRGGRAPMQPSDLANNARPVEVGSIASRGDPNCPAENKGAAGSGLAELRANMAGPIEQQSGVEGLKPKRPAPQRGRREPIRAIDRTNAMLPAHCISNEGKGESGRAKLCSSTNKPVLM